MNYLKHLNKYVNKLNGNIKENTNFSLNNLFRELSYREKQPVNLYDFRDITEAKPNNKVIITCEHASNKTHAYKIPKLEKEYFNTHWGYDLGAKEMTIDVAEEAEVLTVLTNFSRLIIDPNRSLLSQSLIRKIIEKDIELSFNKEENLDRENRIINYYIPYYNILNEALNFLNPNYVISIHSFTKQYEDDPAREFEVGVLYREKGLLSEKIEAAYKREGVNYRINEPYDARDGLCFTLESIISHNQPNATERVEGVMLEFRNDFCSNKDFRRKQSLILGEIIKSLNI